MADRLDPLASADPRIAWLGRVLAAGLGLLAYRALWLGSLELDVEGWLFRPGALPGAAVLGVAGWLWWTRRRGFGALPPLAAPRPAIGFAVLGTGLFVWALLTRKADLLFPSLAFNALAIVALARGWPGVRMGLFPALVLLLGVALPKPLEDEIVWRLQLWTAEGTAWLLTTVGYEVAHTGVILRRGEHTFHVIDSCSGLNGIAILTLIALLLRELFGGSRWRTAWLVVLAPPLGLALNVVRVAYIAVSPNPQELAGVDGDHTLQGMAVLMTGTAILYGVGWVLTRRGVELGSPAPSLLPGRATVSPWIAAVPVLAVLVGLSWGMPPFPQVIESPRRGAIDFPEQQDDWVSEPAPREPMFIGALTKGIHRRFERAQGIARPPEIVDVLIGYDDPRSGGSTRMLSSKLLVPGPEWRLLSRERERLWVLGREAELAMAGREPGGERALVYAWQPRDAGLWSESWRALLGLDRTPWRRDPPRAVVRVVAYTGHDGRLALDLARQRITRFIREFREPLTAL